MNSDRIDIHVYQPSNYNRGSEYSICDLCESLWYYFNTCQQGKELYDRWLSNGDTTITLVKGIHNTSWDLRQHFTIRVGTKVYHAYLNAHPVRYILQSQFSGKISNIIKPVVLFITEAHVSDSPLASNFFRKKTSKKKARCEGREAFLGGYRVQPYPRSKPSILTQLNIE